jgi:hypothetical protein
LQLIPGLLNLLALCSPAVLIYRAKLNWLVAREQESEDHGVHGANRTEDGAYDGRIARFGQSGYDRAQLAITLAKYDNIQSTEIL